MSALRSHASVKVSTGPIFLWKWMFVFHFQNSSRRHLECPCPKSLQMTGPTSSSRTYRGTSKRMHPILLPPSSHLEVKDKTKNCQAVTHLSAPPRKHQMSRRRQTPQNQLLGPGGGWVAQYFFCSQCEDNQRCYKVIFWAFAHAKTGNVICVQVCQQLHSGRIYTGSMAPGTRLKAFPSSLSKPSGTPPCLHIYPMISRTFYITIDPGLLQSSVAFGDSPMRPWGWKAGLDVFVHLFIFSWEPCLAQWIAAGFINNLFPGTFFFSDIARYVCKQYGYVTI